MLLIDSFNAGLELCINEATGERNLLKFRGRFSEANQINKNKRMYPFEVLDENVKRLQEVVAARRLLGELDHPADSIIHFEKASHLITKLWWDGNTLMGEAEILTTPHGSILKELLNNGVSVGVSSRGVGNGKVNENGILVISESYKLITFDAVADASCPDAGFSEKVTGSKKEYFLPDSSTKITNESIHNSKDLFIAALSSVIKEATNKVKGEL